MFHALLLQLGILGVTQKLIPSIWMKLIVGLRYNICSLLFKFQTNFVCPV